MEQKKNISATQVAANWRIAWRSLALASLMAAASLSSGCASVEGSQRPILGVPATAAMVEQYDLATALAAYGQDGDAARGGLGKQAYRDTIVGIYMSAIDARYHEFRSGLSSEGRQTALGLDLAVLGFTGWASVAKESIVNGLSAVAGTRAAIDKNLYFDKALPALIAAMDSERLKVGAEIRRNLQRSPGEYPLVLAIGDLGRYEMAGSLDLALHQVTAQAAQERGQSQEKYEHAVRACDSEEDLVANRATVMKWVVARQAETPPNAAGLKNLVDRMGLGVRDDADAAVYATAARRTIQNDLAQNYCSNAKLTALSTAARSTDWGSEM